MLAFMANRAARGRPYGDKEPDVEPVAPSDDWKRLGEPQPGDWLYSFPEPGQTFAEYKREVRNRKTKERNKMCVVPLGGIVKQHPELAAKVARFLSIFFDCETNEIPAQALPKIAYNSRRRQYDASAVLDRVMLPLVGERGDVLGMMGLASEDLYHGDLNFVFGVASLDQRVGVHSVCRFYRWIPEGADREKVGLRRTLETGVHEMGHILSMRHCTFYECVMCGSNSLDESDRRPIFLCPVCLHKLEWNLGFDRLERYRRLKAFFEDCEFEEEAAFCERRIDELVEKTQADQ